MNGISRSLCTFEDIRTDNRAKDKCTRLRLTLHDQPHPVVLSESRSKPVGCDFALVQPPPSRLHFEPVKPTEEKVEVIKVYLEASSQKPSKHQQNLKMLSDELSQIQEVRYCLKTLREQMAARKSSNSSQFPTNGYRVHQPNSQSTFSENGEHREAEETQDWEDEQESARMREVSKRLYAQLQEAERRHQEDRERLQAESGQYRQQLHERSERLREAQRGLEERDQRVEDLQRLLSGMEVESASLRDKMRASEAELLELRMLKEDRRSTDQRSEELQKELAVTKEKIHHLDDMLKSQQRKIRHMIEQLQNSRTVIQERDRVIQDLEEKVAFLEAENREMHEKVDYFLGGQKSGSFLPPDHHAQIVYSKPLRPSTQNGKALPFIKVIETKS